jgi:hypothetical protein
MIVGRAAVGDDEAGNRFRNQLLLSSLDESEKRRRRHATFLALMLVSTCHRDDDQGALYGT